MEPLAVPVSQVAQASEPRKIRRYTQAPLAVALYRRGLTVAEFCRRYRIQSSGLSRTRNGIYRPLERYVLAVQDAVAVDREAAVELLLSAGGPQGKVMDSEVKAEAIRLCGSGMTAEAVGVQLGVSGRAVRYWLQWGTERRRKGSAWAKGKATPKQKTPAMREVSRLRRVMLQAKRVPGGQLRIASPGAYESLRKICNEAAFFTRALARSEQRFLVRLETALESYQRVHGLERAA